MKEDLIVHVGIPGALILHPGVLNTYRDHLLQVFKKKMPPQLQLHLSHTECFSFGTGAWLAWNS